VSILIHFSGGLRKTIFSTTVRFGRSGSSKVIDFGTNRRRVCNFVLVHHSNGGPILHHFRDIAGFCPHDPTPTHSTLIWGFPLVQIANVGVNQSKYVKPFSPEIVFEVFQPMWSRYLNVTDGQTDGRTTYCGITALCVASHGNRSDHICQSYRRYKSGTFSVNQVKLSGRWRQGYTSFSFCMATWLGPHGGAWHSGLLSAHSV